MALLNWRWVESREIAVMNGRSGVFTSRITHRILRNLGDLKRR